MDSGQLAWGITATALVLLMTPGVAFFYGGLLKAKSVVSMMMMSFGSLALVGVLWVLYGFSMSAVDGPLQFAGNPLASFSLEGLGNEDLLGAAFGATFAIITVALISYARQFGRKRRRRDRNSNYELGDRNENEVTIKRKSSEGN